MQTRTSYGTVTKKAQVTTPVSGVRLDFTNRNGKSEYAVFTSTTLKNEELREQIKSVQVGDMIKLTKTEGKNGFYNASGLEQLQEIPEKKEFTPNNQFNKSNTGSKSTGGFDPLGPITGMITGKAIDLAVGESKRDGTAITMQHLKEAALRVIELNQYVKEQDLSSLLVNQSSNNNTTQHKTPTPVSLDTDEDDLQSLI